MKRISLFVLLTAIASWPTAARLEAKEGAVKAPPSAAAKKFIGRWKGVMEQNDHPPFPVEIEIKDFAFGRWSGVLRHAAPVDADGNLLGVKLEGKTMTLAATITRGRERCMDGLSVLTLIDDNTMERVWIDPNTGKGRARGWLKRQTNDAP